MENDPLSALRTRVHGITRPEKGLLILYLVAALASCFMFPIIFVPLFFRYETLRYRFDDEGVFMSFGVIFRREMQLTYARMQDIHLSQNIIERWLGIGTVTIQTAGSGSASQLTVAGVRDCEAIRDYLYARMRGVREAKHAPAAGDAVLVEIRDALREATVALKERR
jgi:putative membrane protein